ncbi:oligosaccharide flippase family protein [Winogradskyella flava]|uniref:Oligosaccharide flippase family protein n=1 Tax=Winogradskyella flava TaxID=1884876 RepID=A0A842IPQ0_9FLAO|nr:oligosaccharide flippase family protein [Winogradskyella flava]
MSILKNKDYRIILKNFSYLSLLKVFNIGFKFVLVAYLIRVLGTEIYGVFTWADSILQFFLMFINFGFNVYAAKYIVDNRNNKKTIDEVVSSIYTIKTALFLISFLILFATSIFKPINQNFGLLFLMLFIGIGEVLFPIWFYQGMERLKTATIIVFFSRLFIVITTICLVKSSTDLYIYVSLIIASSIIMGVLGVYSLKKHYGINFRMVKKKTILNYFKAASMFFLGRFMLLVFNFGTIFLIGVYSTMDDVTGFDIASKIIMLAVIPFEMIQSAVFPTISRTLDKKLLKRLVLLGLVVGIVLMIGINMFTTPLLLLFGGQEILDYGPALQFLSILTPLTSVTFVLGSCALVAFGYFKEYNLSLLISSLFYIVIVLLLYLADEITFWNLIYLRVISEFVLVFIRTIFAVNKKILFSID